MTDISGQKSNYSIRVLKCNNKACPTTYHRELPNIIIPYKRYDAESIEDAIERSNSEISVAADETTIWRWRRWFKTNATNINEALNSVFVTNKDDAEVAPPSNQKQESQKPIEEIKRKIGREQKWLCEAARILINCAKWPFNRSAFLTG